MGGSGVRELELDGDVLVRTAGVRNKSEFGRQTPDENTGAGFSAI